jgi:hypothetical protein
VFAPEDPPTGDSDSKGRGTGGGGSVGSDGKHGVIGEDGGFRPVIIFVAFVAHDEPMF